MKIPSPGDKVVAFLNVPFHKLCRCEKQCFLKHGAGAEVSGPRTTIHLLKCTPLHCAAMGGHSAVVELLLVANPELPAVRDRRGKTAAWWAARAGHTALAERLKALEPGKAKGKTKYQVAPEPPPVPKE